MPDEKKPNEQPKPSESPKPSATPPPDDSAKDEEAVEVPYQKPEEKNLGEQLVEEAEKQNES